MVYCENKYKDANVFELLQLELAPQVSKYRIFVLLHNGDKILFCGFKLWLPTKVNSVLELCASFIFSLTKYELILKNISKLNIICQYFCPKSMELYRSEVYFNDTQNKIILQLCNFYMIQNFFWGQSATLMILKTKFFCSYVTST